MLDANAMNRQSLRNALIRQALSGHHLHNWLSTGDLQAAISYSRGLTAGGMLDDGDSRFWWQTIPKGVIAADRFSHDHDERSALVFVSWQELADVVANGATPERLERLNATGQAWSDWHAAQPRAHVDPYQGMSKEEREAAIEVRSQSLRLVDRDYAAARRDVIDAGLANQLVQQELF